MKTNATDVTQPLGTTLTTTFSVTCYWKHVFILQKPKHFMQNNKIIKIIAFSDELNIFTITLGDTLITTFIRSLF